MPSSASSRIGTLLNSTFRRRMVALSLAVFTGLSLASMHASSASAAPISGLRIGDAVFKLLNQERAAHHLRPLGRSNGLNHSATAHNKAMAAANVMSHQVSREADLGARISRTGYHWRTAAENVGWNSDMSVAGAQRLEIMMINERAPFDGHRKNILNPKTHDVGINVLVDYRHHKIWLTEDFGTLA